MKKKTLAFVLAALMLLGLMAGCGDTAEPTPAPDEPEETTTDEVTDKTADETPAAEAVTFTVGFDADFPPFGFINDAGDYDGFDLACAKEVCARLGWTFEAQPIDWDAKDAELNSGTIDCIWNGFTMNGREDSYTWTDAYYDNSIVVVVRADSGIESLADLAGKSVMVQSASSALDALESEDNADFYNTLGEVLEESDYNLGFLDLGQGTVDAVIVDVGVANYHLAARSGDYVILDEAVSTEQYGIGFKKGNTELCATVQAVMEEMAADGTLDAIAAQYEAYGLVPDAIVY